LSNPVIRQTDRQTDAGENITFLAEAIKTATKMHYMKFQWKLHEYSTLKNDLLTTELEPVHESSSDLVSELGRVGSGHGSSVRSQPVSTPKHSF